MRLLAKKRILNEIRQGAVKEYEKRGLHLIGGPAMISFGTKEIKTVFDSMTDDELWKSLPPKMVTDFENDDSEELIGLDWKKIRDRLKVFWEKYGDMIIAGIKILLSLLMFVKDKQGRK
jgi:hypothetical protein